MALLKDDGLIELRNANKLPVIIDRFDDEKKLNEKIKDKLFLRVKRLFDIGCAIVGCMIALVAAIFIKIIYLAQGDTKSIFFIQKRIGKDGELFNLIKFRSMKVNAEELLKNILEKDENLREEYKKYHKLNNDPRITNVGDFIRKTSIDELPQFFNILRGEMSMIGPRPYLPREVDEMGQYYEIIIKHKPALTGLWQIRGRSTTTFEDRLRYDLKYHNEFGLKQDTKIFFKTFSTVLKNDGTAK